MQASCRHVASLLQACLKLSSLLCSLVPRRGMVRSRTCCRDASRSALVNHIDGLRVREVTRIRRVSRFAVASTHSVSAVSSRLGCRPLAGLVASRFKSHDSTPASGPHLSQVPPCRRWPRPLPIVIYSCFAPTKPQLSVVSDSVTIRATI